MRRTIEASVLENVDHIPLFLGSVVDVLCENEDVADATAAFTLYVGLVSFKFRCLAASFWTKKILLQLDEEIKEFIGITKKVFENHQSSEMDT